MQPVAALAAENPNGQVQGQVVGVLARDPEVADADLGLHRVRLVDDDDAPRRLGRLDEPIDRHVAPLPVAEDLPRPANASSAVTSPTIARIALLAAKYRWWKATRSSRVSAAIDSGVPVCGMPYGWNP